jgi:hypothetical protein
VNRRAHAFAKRTAVEDLAILLSLSADVSVPLVATVSRVEYVNRLDTSIGHYHEHDCVVDNPASIRGELNAQLSTEHVIQHSRVVRAHGSASACVGRSHARATLSGVMQPVAPAR